MSRAVDRVLGVEVFIDRRVVSTDWPRTIVFVRDGEEVPAGRAKHFAERLALQAFRAELPWPYRCDITITVKSLDQFDDEDVRQRLVMLTMKAAGINTLTNKPTKKGQR